MSDAMWLEGKEYISSKRASQLSGYAQDYIGQLARKGLIDAQRVGGLWFISMTSLTDYKSNADAYVPPQPERKTALEADSLVTFEGKDHISAARAASITGYHPDYVGQLARSGTIISRQVGNRWYVDREGILAHKQEKDSLLGAVQAQSVGITRNHIPVSTEVHGRNYNDSESFLTYTRDDRALMPVLTQVEKEQDPYISQKEDESEINEFDTKHAVPIRVIQRAEILQHTEPVKRVKTVIQIPAKTIDYGVFRGLAAAALTVVIVLSFGFVTLKSSSIYGTNTTPDGTIVESNTFTAAAANALGSIADFIENLVDKELVYVRSSK